MNKAEKSIERGEKRQGRGRGQKEGEKGRRLGKTTRQEGQVTERGRRMREGRDVEDANRHCTVKSTRYAYVLYQRIHDNTCIYSSGITSVHNTDCHTPTDGTKLVKKFIYNKNTY